MLRCGGGGGGTVIVADALGVEVVVVVVVVGFRRSVRLPVLAHPALPISCLPAEKCPAAPLLQLKTLLSQPKVG